jgi:DNA-binding beta-propeller fold protein YncE
MRFLYVLISLSLFLPFAQAEPSPVSNIQNTGTGPLRLIQRIPLPQVEGRIDHMAVDVAGQRLFVAALGNNTLEVVDLKKGERTRSVTGFHEPQGIRYLPESNTIVVANGWDGITTFLDGSSLRPINTVRFSGDADNVRFDAAHKRIYIGYGDGALGVLNDKGERIGDIPLGGHPESFQIDSVKGRIYVNVPTRREIAVVDMDKMKVTTTWPVKVAGANYPMALDEAHRRLFVMTRKPPHLLVYDTETGRLVSTIEGDADSDDVFYDATRSRIYAGFGYGTVIVYQQLDSDHYNVVARIPTAAGARTAIFSPELRKLYVAVPHRANQTAEVRVYEAES